MDSLADRFEKWIATWGDGDFTEDRHKDFVQEAMSLHEQMVALEMERARALRAIVMFVDGFTQMVSLFGDLGTEVVTLLKGAPGEPPE